MFKFLLLPQKPTCPIFLFVCCCCCCCCFFFWGGGGDCSPLSAPSLYVYDHLEASHCHSQSDPPPVGLILGFHQSSDQTKNRNHSINKFKNLELDRRFLYQQPQKESGLCCYSQKCVTQIRRALYGDAMFVPFGGAQTWRTQRIK